MCEMTTGYGTASLTCHSVALALVATLGHAVAHAQDVHLEILGGPSWVMSKVRATGDVDGDGVSELVIGGIGTGSMGFGGFVQLVSGSDGHLIHPTIFGPSGYGYGAWVDGVGDFDGDGVPDFASGVLDVGPGIFDGEVNVWSGDDAALLAHIPSPLFGSRKFGWEVTGLGDLDGDGNAEIGVVFFLEGHVMIYGGPDGHLFRIHRGDGCNGPSGPHGSGPQPYIDSIGDLDLDGVSDYAIGWHRAENACLSGGVVFVYSGRTGDVLWQFDVLGQSLGNPNFGQAVAGMSDVTGDGVPDLAVSATFDNSCTSTGPPDPAFIRIFSLTDGSIVRQIDVPRVYEWADGCTYFRLHSDGHDVNGDGVPDLAAGSPFADRQLDPCTGSMHGGLVSIFSGRTGSMLWQHHVIGDGNGLALTGDLTGDGISEFAVGSRSYSCVNIGGGKVTVYEGAPGDAERVCTTSPNSAGPGATIGLDGPISVGNNRLHLFVDGGVPGESGVFFYGSDLVSLPIGDGVLCAGGGALGQRRITGPIQIDAMGSVLEPVEMTQGPMGAGPAAWTAGSTWIVQFGYRDPGGPGGTGLNFSDAMRIMFTP